MKSWGRWFACSALLTSTINAQIAHMKDAQAAWFFMGFSACVSLIIISCGTGENQ